MDVRRKQLLVRNVVLLLSAGLAAVSAHVISIVMRFVGMMACLHSKEINKIELG